MEYIHFINLHFLNISEKVKHYLKKLLLSKIQISEIKNIYYIKIIFKLMIRDNTSI